MYLFSCHDIPFSLDSAILVFVVNSKFLHTHRHEHRKEREIFTRASSRTWNYMRMTW